ncbi:MAG TPA: ABC transporter ATP-binding protein [Pirellulales bacterium]|nr:ABC transporter ATP-binding protein [Pirellulales bacterium]
MPLFDTRSVSKIYRRGSAREIRALDAVSLTIEKGTCCALAGASGSGKSTLLALLGALDRPTAGEVIFEGRTLAGLSDVGLTRIRRRLGFVFQNFSLLPRLRVWENVSYPLVPRGISSARRLARAQELLEPLGLGDRLDDLAAELSGGEQQRVAVARALAGEPMALLADEPTSQLDQEAAERLWATFDDLARRGMTLVICSHDPRFLTRASQVVRL